MVIGWRFSIAALLIGGAPANTSVGVWQAVNFRSAAACRLFDSRTLPAWIFAPRSRAAKDEASSESTLSLAGAAGSRYRIGALLTLREVRDVRVRDFSICGFAPRFRSIQKALAGLDRTTLAAVATLSPNPTSQNWNTRYSLALIDRDG